MYLFNTRTHINHIWKKNGKRLACNSQKYCINQTCVCVCAKFAGVFERAPSYKQYIHLFCFILAFLWHFVVERKKQQQIYSYWAGLWIFFLVFFFKNTSNQIFLYWLHVYICMSVSPSFTILCMFLFIYRKLIIFTKLQRSNF